MRRETPEQKPSGGRPQRFKALVTFLFMHCVLLVYSLSGIFSKNAASQPFPSVAFFVLYAGMIFVLGLYALGWQQVLKRLPLTLAFANKAITVVWGLVLGVLFYGETITWQMALGALLVILGVVVFSIADGRERKVADAAAEEKPE